MAIVPPTDRLRHAMPPVLVRTLSRRRRVKHFNVRLEAGRLDQLSAIVGNRDPFAGSDALFQAIDYLMAEGKSDRLHELASLARNSGPFAARTWRALCLWAEGDREQSKAAFNRMAQDKRYQGFARRSAEAWVLYLERPAFKPVERSDPAPLMQFWDTPEPPSDVAKEMRIWQDLAGEAYTRLSLSTARQYFKEQFGRTEADLFERCPHPAVQSDFARLGWLLANGGIYVDADARMRPGFPDLYRCLGDGLVFWFRTAAAEVSILNGFVAAPAGSNFMSAAFATACERLASGKEMHVFDYAGPSLWTETALILADQGLLEPVQTISDRTGSKRIMKQANARYKSDHRNWRVWMKDAKHASG